MSNFGSAATSRGRISIVFFPKMSGVEWWVGRLNNAFAAPGNIGKYSEYYHKDNNLTLANWLYQSSDGNFNTRAAGLMTVDMYQVRLASEMGVAVGAVPAAQNQCARRLV